MRSSSRVMKLMATPFRPNLPPRPILQCGVKWLSCRAELASLPVDVVLPIGWEVIIDDKGDLLNINASCLGAKGEEKRDKVSGETDVSGIPSTYQQIGSNEHTGGARSELPHDDVTVLLLHVSMLGEEGKDQRSHTPTSIELTMADTVKSRECIFSVSQSTFRRVFTKMTAWVMVSVS